MRSHVNDRKLKLMWAGRDKWERLILTSHEFRERFYEAAWAVRNEAQRLVRPSVVTAAENHQRTAAAAPGSGEERLSVFLGTWNLGNAPPPRHLEAWLRPDETKCDIYALSAQEVNSETEWFRLVQGQLGDEYITVGTQSLLMMRLIVLARKEHRHKISSASTGSEATGIGNVIGNKGGLGISFNFIETSLCFVGCHLAARDEKAYARNEDYCMIVNNLRLSNSVFDLTNEFHALFWFGDLNYRINIPRPDVLKLIAAKQWDKLFRGDQLLLERKHGRCFAGFKESLIRFPPSYRYNRGDRTYSEEKMRTPSYCDRILYKTPPNFPVKCHVYTSCDVITTSDHSPVYGIFSVPIIFPDTRMVAGMAAMPGQEQGGWGMGLDVLLMDVSLQLQPPLLPSPGASVAAKSLPSPFLCFHAPFLASQCPTTTVHNTNNATWSNHQIHTITTSREWLANQHLWILVCDRTSKNRLAQGVVSLSADTTEQPQQFRIKLVAGGLHVGLLCGSLALGLLPTKHSLPEEEIEADSEAVTIKQGYLTKEGKTRKSWKRRWFVLYAKGILSYYNSPAARTAINDVRLRNGSVTALEPRAGKSPTLKLEVPGRVFFISAADKEDLAAWIEVIAKYTQPS